MVHVEIKQIDVDPEFRQSSGVSSRTVGSHVRQKIADARKQAQAASRAGCPAILLIHNNLDPMQLFGTERHDFLSGMYGEMTLTLKRGGGVSDSYYGRNSKLRESQNTSFSGVGHLTSAPTGPRVQLFENTFARVPLNFDSLPTCIDVVRVTVDDHFA